MRAAATFSGSSLCRRNVSSPPQQLDPHTSPSLGCPGTAFSLLHPPCLTPCTVWTFYLLLQSSAELHLAAGRGQQHRLRSAMHHARPRTNAETAAAAAAAEATTSSKHIILGMAAGASSMGGLAGVRAEGGNVLWSASSSCLRALLVLPSPVPLSPPTHIVWSPCTALQRPRPATQQHRTRSACWCLRLAPAWAQKTSSSSRKQLRCGALGSSPVKQ